VLSEVWSPVGDPVAGRPSVYLDQSHWSTVAKYFVRPDALSSRETSAVKRLVELAQDGGIRLPLSSATLQETAQLFGDRRYEVGIAIAGLGGGWQLRDPIEVRRHEFASWFAERLELKVSISSADAVTLEPQSVFGNSFNGVSRAQLGASAQSFVDALTWPSVMLALLIDPEATPSTRPSAWAKANQELAGRLSDLPRGRRRLATTLAAVLDNRGTMTEALAVLGDPSELMPLLRPGDLQEAVREPTFGGLFTDLMSSRLSDAGRTWLPNDLNDMMFLACAAAYCDYVAAERPTGRQLQQVLRARGRRQNVHVSLPELVQALSDDRVRTATERSAGSEHSSAEND
jgi:hypothetical protein